MNSRTRSLIREIRTKIKNQITGTSEFASDDAVIDAAVIRFHEILKQQKVL